MKELDPITQIELYLTSKKTAEQVANPLVALAGCSLDTHPTKHNWVEDAGGLPQYICEIARAILRGGTKDVGRAISIAVARCKVWAAGGGNVNADTRAKAASAVAEWEAKKAKSHVKASAIDDDDIELTALEILEVELAARTFSADARKKYSSNGVAMADGSFPIPDKDALRRAIDSFGRAPKDKRSAVKAHIKKRARALGATSMLPEGW